MIVDDAVRAACRAVLDRASGVVLATRVAPHGRRVSTFADGYVPVLVDATEEDREAKGLRRLERGHAPRIAVHETALEAADRERLLLLTGPAGSGKHTFLLHLAAHLAGSTIADSAWTLDGLVRPAPRNDAGTVIAERWSGPATLPLFLDTTGSFESSLTEHGGLGLRVSDGSQAALLLVDRAERLGDRGPAWLAEADALAMRCPLVRILFAGDADAFDRWRVPATFARRRVIPLFEAQRTMLRTLLRPDASPLVPADPQVAGRIGFYTLALENGVVDEPAAAVVDRWLERSDGGVAQEAAAVAGREPPRHAQPFIAMHLDARRLQTLSIETVGMLHRADPARWSGPVRVLALRMAAEGRSLDALVAALMRSDGAGSADGMATAIRIAAEAPTGRLDAVTRHALFDALVPLVERGRMPLAARVAAGRALATAGDPRDLDALVPIAAGPFTMGTTAHPNGAPPHVVTLGAYRIGRYPVTNDRYRRFVEATGRDWRSKDGSLPHRSNSPAVDLTWHDARAYCDWLTTRWRAAGRIGAADVVRLPTEPEWERAARGAQSVNGIVYPWGGPWKEDHANSAEAGLNEPCPVGLFPHGRSFEGADDMAGQVWEWTTTLWGEDMASPRFAYPWTNDGREDLDASPDVRRVLRGGCFLSPREKANCVYRGSLEPDGFWRGNGFRIVVAVR